MAINSSVDTNTRDCIKLFMQITYFSREICELVDKLLLHIYIHVRFALLLYAFCIQNSYKLVNASRL